VEENVERDIEKDLIEIECAIKSQKEKDNIFTMSVLQRCHKLVSELKRYKESGLAPEEIEGLNFSSNQLRLVNLLEEERKKHKWIPCSERLPENPIPDTFYGLSEPDTYPEYIVMIAGAQEPTFLKYAGSGEWYRDGNFYKVIAWMPLPAPYKEN
jgi:hypothetical protein